MKHVKSLFDLSAKVLFHTLEGR